MPNPDCRLCVLIIDGPTPAFSGNAIKLRKICLGGLNGFNHLHCSNLAIPGCPILNLMALRVTGGASGTGSTISNSLRALRLTRLFYERECQEKTYPICQASR